MCLIIIIITIIIIMIIISLMHLRQLREMRCTSNGCNLPKSQSIMHNKSNAVNRGKVAFANPGAVLRYYIGQTFLATFRSDLDLLRANNNWNTDQNAGYK